MQDSIVTEGYLEKKSRYLGLARERWCVLKGKWLLSYKQEDFYKNPTEELDLTIYNQIQYQNSRKFMLVSTVKNMKTREFIAQSHDDMVHWVDTIQSVYRNLNQIKKYRRHHHELLCQYHVYNLQDQNAENTHKSEEKLLQPTSSEIVNAIEIKVNHLNLETKIETQTPPSDITSNHHSDNASKNEDHEKKQKDLNKSENASDYKTISCSHDKNDVLKGAHVWPTDSIHTSCRYYQTYKEVLKCVQCKGIPRQCCTDTNGHIYCCGCAQNQTGVDFNETRQKFVNKLKVSCFHILLDHSCYWVGRICDFNKHFRNVHLFPFPYPIDIKEEVYPDGDVVKKSEWRRLLSHENPHHFKHLLIEKGGILTVNGWDEKYKTGGKLILMCNSLIVEGGINLNYAGYKGGKKSQSPYGNGWCGESYEKPSRRQMGNNGGGGGQYSGGGYGTRGGGKYGGRTYGDKTLSHLHLGSGGGGDFFNMGECGGGALKIKTKLFVIHDQGRITANGGCPSNRNTGGGSGGSIFIECDRFIMGNKQFDKFMISAYIIKMGVYSDVPADIVLLIFSYYHIRSKLPKWNKHWEENMFCNYKSCLIQAHGGENISYKNYGGKGRIRLKVKEIEKCTTYLIHPKPYIG